MATNEITCGIPYYPTLLKSVDGGSWTEVQSSYWASSIVDGSKLDFSGISVSTIGEQLSTAYAVDSSIKFAAFDSLTQVWSIIDFAQLFINEYTDTTKSDAFLAEHGGNPQIAYVDSIKESVSVLRLTSLVSNKWYDQPVDTHDDIDNVSISSVSGVLYIYHRAIEGTASSLNVSAISGTGASTAWSTTTLLSGTANDCKCSSAVIAGVVCLAYSLSGNLLFTRPNLNDPQEIETSTLIDSGSLISKIVLGSDANNNTVVVYVIDNGGTQLLKYAVEGESSFTVTTIYTAGSGEVLQDPVDFALVRDSPTIIFGTNSAIKMATLQIGQWVITTFSTATIYDAGIDVYNGHPVVISVQNTTPSGVIPTHQTTSVIADFYNGAEIRAPGLQNEFKCDCTSSIFVDAATHIDLVPKWNKDIRLTDNYSDCMRPRIDARHSSDAIVVGYHSKNTDGTSRILGGVYRVAEQDKMFMSGSSSWFDYEFHSDGTKFAICNDLYDNISLAYVVARAKTDSGYLMPGLSTNVGFKVYKFSDSEDPANYPPAYDQNFSSASNIYRTFVDDDANLILEDPYISKHLVRKIRIKNIDRLTFNSSGSVVAVVSVQALTIHMYGTPEVYAFRIKNENGEYLSWAPWSPEPGRYYIETQWNITAGSGLKQICVQLMSYAGQTSEFCLQVVADYDIPSTEIKLYYDVEGERKLLPQIGILPVASINDEAIALTHLAENVVTLQTSRTVYVDIAVARQIGSGPITFDVIKQGTDDVIHASTGEFTTLTDGRKGYQGSFEIYAEDSRTYKDGLAKIVVSYDSLTDQTSTGGGDDGGGGGETTTDEYVFVTSGQSGGPTFNWTEIASTGTNCEFADDSNVVAVALPFAFSFYGTTHTSVNIDQDGVLVFGEYLGSFPYSNASLPTPISPNPFIAIYWDDLYPKLLNNVYYQIVGNSPTRKLVVQWQNVDHYPETDPITFQVQLSEGSGQILMLYSNMGQSAGSSATVGIQRDSSTAVQYSSSQNIITSQLALLCKPV